MPTFTTGRCLTIASPAPSRIEPRSAAIGSALKWSSALSCGCTVSGVNTTCQFFSTCRSRTVVSYDHTSPSATVHSTLTGAVALPSETCGVAGRVQGRLGRHQVAGQRLDLLGHVGRRQCGTIGILDRDYAEIARAPAVEEGAKCLLRTRLAGTPTRPSAGDQDKYGEQ